MRAFSRREFLTVAATAPLALQSLGLIDAAEAHTRYPLITLFLSGGASAKETFNPDPHTAPAELRGPLRSIQTQTGTRFSELFPELARRSHMFSLLRALDSGSSDHETSQATAMRRGSRTIAEVVGDRAARTVPYVLINPGSNYSGLRSAFRISSAFTPLYDTQQRRFTPSPLGPQPESTEQNEFDEEGIPMQQTRQAPSVPAGPPPGLAERRRLLRAFDTTPIHSPAVARLERFRETAFDLLLGGGRFFEALSLPDRDRERYGRTLAGDMTLLAKRFVERGAGAVTIYHEPENVAWDAHSGLAQRYRTMAPEIDHAAATLIDEIHRHRIECVFLLMGEFNRTPRMNSGAGRDHWQYGNCAILAGGHSRPGITHGHTTVQGTIRDGGVQQRDVLGNTVLAAARMDLDPAQPRVRDILQ